MFVGLGDVGLGATPVWAWTGCELGSAQVGMWVEGGVATFVGHIFYFFFEGGCLMPAFFALRKQKSGTWLFSKVTFA